MKIIIVDDSVLMRSIIKQVIEDSGSDIEIIGECSNGKAAYDMALELSPDLILMDLNMPVWNGLEATEAIMRDKPTPIVIFSNEIDADKTFKAMRLGATECLMKPEISMFNEPSFYENFIEKLHIISEVNIRSLKRDYQHRFKQSEIQYSLVVIGASTGGPKALSYLLGNLPPDFPVGIALVQHLDSGFEKSYVEWLDTLTALKVRLSENNDEAKPGEVLVAPVDKHLICRGRRLYLDDGPKVLNQKPAVDRLFSTASECYRDRLIGVLLTGMGRDGAQGCLEIKNNNGLTLVQNKESSAIYGMPKAAVELGGATKILDLKEMPTVLNQIVRK